MPPLCRCGFTCSRKNAKEAQKTETLLLGLGLEAGVLCINQVGQFLALLLADGRLAVVVV